MTYAADCLCWEQKMDNRKGLFVHIQSPTGTVITLKHGTLKSNKKLRQLGAIIRCVIKSKGMFLIYDSVRVPFAIEEMEELVRICKIKSNG